MIYDNLEFFNVEYLEKRPNIKGVILNRYSEVGKKGVEDLDIRVGSITALYANECEIRFVTNRQNFNVYLSALNIDGYVNVYCGELYYDTYHIKSGKITSINLAKHQDIVDALEIGDKKRFSKDVWRIVFLKRFVGLYHGIDVGNGTVRPPKKEELPKKTFLAYGSSISFGAISGKLSDLSYLQILARKLKAQCLNKSMPGSCFIEKSVVDYILSVENVDYYYFELGGNMLHRYTVPEFKERAEYLLNEAVKKYPKKKIYVTDTFEYFSRVFDPKNVERKETLIGFNKALQEILCSINSKYLIYIDSKKIIDDSSYLCVDLLHPSHFGSIHMANNLYREIQNDL